MLLIIYQCDVTDLLVFGRAKTPRWLYLLVATGARFVNVAQVMEPNSYESDERDESCMLLLKEEGEEWNAPIDSADIESTVRVCGVGKPSNHFVPW